MLLPGDTGYITKNGDGTNLPEGLMCVGLYGGWNGSVFTKSLYIDKRGTNTSGVNQGTAPDPQFEWGYSGVITGVSDIGNGLANTNHLTQSPAANYCRNKGTGWFLPTVRQFGYGVYYNIVFINNNSAYAFEVGSGLNFWYWVSNESGNYPASCAYSYLLDTGAYSDGWGKLNLFRVRCCREY